MKVSPEGLYFLASHEGVVPAPYLDSVNVWTYGVGHAETSGTEPNPRLMPKGMPEDLDAALRNVFDVFERDLERYAADVRRAVKVAMSQHEFDAAVSFHFNTGAIGKATWVKTWNAGNKDLARRQIMNWKKPPEIIGRRTAEQTLWATGEYGNGRVNVYRVNDAGRLRGSFKVMSKAEVLALMAPEAPTQPQVSPARPTTGRSPFAAFLSAVFKFLSKGGPA